MKKILIIPSWYPNKDNPGLGSFFREQAALFEDDFDIRILAGHLNADISRVKKLKNTARFALLKKVSVQKNDDYFLSPPFVYGFEYTKGLNRFTKANFQLKIKGFLDYFEQNILTDWKPDLIHAQNTNMAGIIACYISEKFQIPFIITDHHHLNPHVPVHFQNEIKLALANSKANCFVSEWQYRTYLLLDSNLKGVVVGNPVDSDFFKPAKKNTSNFVITHASNADFPKDINTLIATLINFFSITKNNEDVLINLIGFPEQLTNKLEKQLSAYSWFKQVKFYLPIPKQEYVRILQKSDVFLMTSICESFGLASLEAMLCGVPVVTTNNGGVNEYFIENVNGIKVPVKDIDALAEALIKIYKNPNLFNPELIRNSVIQKFGVEIFKHKMQNIYSSQFSYGG